MSFENEAMSLKEWGEKLGMTEIEIFKAVITFLTIKAEIMGIPQKVVCRFPKV